MTQFPLTEAFMAQVFAAKTGKDRQEAAEACAMFLAISQAMQLITAATLDHSETDARAFDLRGKRLEDGRPCTATVISFRIGLSRRRVFEAIRRHQARRRAALRIAS